MVCAFAHRACPVYVGPNLTSDSFDARCSARQKQKSNETQERQALVSGPQNDSS